MVLEPPVPDPGIYISSETSEKKEVSRLLTEIG